MKLRLLVTRKVFPEVIEALSSAYDVRANQDDAAWTHDEFIARLADCEALYVVATDRVDAAALAGTAAR
jgi:gluconate 2-dehydrogenase